MEYHRPEHGPFGGAARPLGPRRLPHARSARRRPASAPFIRPEVVRSLAERGIHAPRSHVMEHPFLKLAAQYFVEPVAPDARVAKDHARAEPLPAGADLALTPRGDETPPVVTPRRERSPSVRSARTPRSARSGRSAHSVTPRNYVRTSKLPDDQRAERFAAREQLREEAHIPSRGNFPYKFDVGWKAAEPLTAPQYSYNPITGAVDAFVMKPDGAQVRIRTDRRGPSLEASAKDSLVTNRRKGVVEYADLMRNTNPRWNAAYHEALTKDDRVFYRKPQAMSTFAENCLKKTGKSAFTIGR